MAKVLLTLLALALAASAAPSIFLAGDSTMTTYGNNDGTRGWGAFLGNYTNLTVINDAIAGRSARSFTREGRFDAMAQAVQAGDFVVIEFGHNDGGTLVPTDNGRSDCPVTNNNYSSTCSTVYNGTAETVLTYYTYLLDATALFQSKNASVLISSPTPDNPWETGSFVYAPNRFTDYARYVAGNTSSAFVDHGQYMADLYEQLGPQTVDAFYPHDHTHTSPQGANVAALAFIEGLQVTNSSLKLYV